MPSLSHTMLAAASVEFLSVASSAERAASRSGAKGCGSMAAALDRASLGASIFAVTVLAVLAVGRTTIGRPRASASPIVRSIMRARSVQCAADAQPLSTTIATGPEPLSVASRDGFITGSASAKMISAAASRRMRVSHQGDFAGVFSWFSMPARMRVGGKVSWRGRGGTVRSSQ